jgi:hypothetical protein
VAFKIYHSGFRARINNERVALCRGPQYQIDCGVIQVPQLKFGISYGRRVQARNWKWQSLRIWQPQLAGPLTKSKATQKEGKGPFGGCVGVPLRMIGAVRPCPPYPAKLCRPQFGLESRTRKASRSVGALGGIMALRSRKPCGVRRAFPPSHDSTRGIAGRAGGRGGLSAREPDFLSACLPALSSGSIPQRLHPAGSTTWNSHAQSTPATGPARTSPSSEESGQKR